MSLYLIFHYGVVMFAESLNCASDKTTEAKKWEGMLSSDKSMEEAVFTHPAVAATTMARGHNCHGPYHWPGRISAALVCLNCFL